MANKTVVAVEVKLDGGEKTSQTVGSIKQQLREANAELIAVRDKFGDTSEEAVKAAQKVAKLKDNIGDAKNFADAFNPDAKFKALGAAIQGTVGGFTALQGAQALFGNESKDLEKTLAKVQGALALSQGIDSVLEARDSFKNLGAVIKGPIVSAFTTLRGALISTGIGALAVGIGLLVANFDKVKQAVLALFPGLAGLGKFIGGVINAVTDFIGVTSEAERATAKFIESTEKELKAGKEFLDRNGDLYDQYTQRKMKADLDYKEKVLEIKKDETKSEAQKNKEISEYNAKRNREILAADTDRNNKIKEGQEAERKENEAKQKERIAKEKEANDKILAERKQLLEKQRALEEDLINELFNRRATEGEKELRQAQINLGKQLETAKGNAELESLVRKNFIQASIDAENKIREEQRKTEKKNQEDDSTLKINTALLTNNTLLQAASAFSFSQTQIQQAAADVQKKIDEEKNKALVDNLSNALNQISNVLGQQSAVGKAVAVASAVINTYQGATKALAQGGIFGFVGAASVIASGFQSIRKILATKIPNSKGGDKGSTAGVSGAAPSVTAPVAPVAETTRLDQQSINAVGNAAGRAFVLESDVSSNQERIRRLNRAARIN